MITGSCSPSGTSRSSTRRGGRVAVSALVGALTLSACSFDGLYGVPLPGGAGGGENSYKVTAEFDNVLDLVPQSSCRVNDVPVGTVSKIELDGFVARATCDLKGDVELPANAVAVIRQTSLLGEKFVSLDGPADAPPRGTLESGAVIPLAQTRENPELEEVFSALSLLLNGGGLRQLDVIRTEFDAAFDGREDRFGDFLQSLDGFVGTLEQQKGAIIQSLEGLDRLSTTLNADKQIIATALEDIPPGLQVLNGQRDELVATLQSLDRLSGVATRVIDASTENTVADLRALEPILRNLRASEGDLVRSLDLLFKYPFPNSSRAGIQGDYTNLFATIQVDAQGLLLLLEGELTDVGGGDSGGGMGGGGGGEAPALPPPPGDGLPQLPLGALDLGSALGLTEPGTTPAPGTPAPGDPAPPALPGEAGAPTAPAPARPGPSAPALPDGSARGVGAAGLSSLLLGGLS